MSKELVKTFQNSIGRFNSRMINSLENSRAHPYEQIVQLTSFLEEETPIVARLYTLKENIDSRPLCTCGEQKKFKRVWLDTCGAKGCKWGDAEKLSNAIKKRDSVAASSKRKQTMLSKYGYTTNSQRPEIKKAASQKVYQYKFIECLKEKTGLLSDVELTEYLKKADILKLCTEFQVSYPHCLAILKEHKLYISNRSTSKPHLIVESLLDELGVEYRRNDRTQIAPKELDIYIGSHKLGVEINGVIWHSELSGGRDSNYHLNKTLLCEEKGIQLLHFLDIEILEKKEIVFSMIRSKLGLCEKIYARKCQFKSVDTKTAKCFFLENHMQGSANASQAYGLYFDDELVACASFVRRRYGTRHDYELLRFANKLNLTVVGGLSKLIKNSGLSSIVSYANRKWSQGRAYEQSGFTYLKTSQPSYAYRKREKLYSRLKFQKHKLPGQLENFDNEISEWENMKNNGWDRIWDCGNLVYEFNQKG